MANNKILLVDYEIKKLKATEEFLRSQGFEVVLAHDGLEALEKFVGEQPAIVLLEAMLPKLHGFEVCKAIKKSEGGRNIPVIIVTGIHKKISHKRQAMNEYLADDYLLKPVANDKLLETIRSFLTNAGRAKPAPDIKAVSPARPELHNQQKPALPEASAPKEIDFEKILNETLADLLQVPKEPKEEKSKLEDPEKDFNRIIEDTLSGLLHDQEGLGIPATTPEAESPSPRDKTLESREPSPLVKAEPPEVAHEGSIYGKYLLIRQIAVGGMAEVFMAKQKGVKGFEKVVAIKRILPHLTENREFLKMFIDEAKVAAQLTHQNIVQIYELGEIDDSYYIAMEYVIGKDLRTILTVGRELQKPLSLGNALFIASRLCSALHYAHRKKGFTNEPLNIVHRDISPQNVLISYDGEVKLVDFGIAKAAAKDSKTQLGAIKGKILYMSPEQAWGKPVDRRSDIFSLGTLMYEMISGKRLFLAANELGILEKVRNAEVPSLRAIAPTITPDVEAVIYKALAKSPNDRYQSAGDMKRELDSCIMKNQAAYLYRGLRTYMHDVFADDIRREAPELLESKDTEDVYDLKQDNGESYDEAPGTSDNLEEIVLHPQIQPPSQISAAPAPGAPQFEDQEADEDDLEADKILAELLGEPYEPQPEPQVRIPSSEAPGAGTPPPISPSDRKKTVASLPGKITDHELSVQSAEESVSGKEIPPPPLTVAPERVLSASEQSADLDQTLRKPELVKEPPRQQPPTSPRPPRAETPQLVPPELPAHSQESPPESESRKVRTHSMVPEVIELQPTLAEEPAMTQEELDIAELLKPPPKRSPLDILKSPVALIVLLAALVTVVAMIISGPSEPPPVSRQTQATAQTQLEPTVVAQPEQQVTTEPQVTPVPMIAEQAATPSRDAQETGSAARQPEQQTAQAQRPTAVPAPTKVKERPTAQPKPTPIPKPPTTVPEPVVELEPERAAVSAVSPDIPFTKITDLDRPAAQQSEPQAPSQATVAPAIAKTRRGDFIATPQVAPQVTKRVNPEYPRMAERLGMEGTVVLQLLIDVSGKVSEVVVISSSAPEKSGLKEAAIKAVTEWQFQPAKHDGVDVTTKITITIPFKKR